MQSQKQKKVFSFPKARFFMPFIDHPSSKSIVEVSPSSPLSPRTIKNTKQNHTNAHHRSFETINLQQTTTYTHIHTRIRVLINFILFWSFFALGGVKHFPLGLRPKCFHLTPYYLTLWWPYIKIKNQTWKNWFLHLLFTSGTNVLNL